MIGVNLFVKGRVFRLWSMCCQTEYCVRCLCIRMQILEGIRPGLLSFVSRCSLRRDVCHLGFHCNCM